MSNADKAADLLIAARRDEEKMDALPADLEPATLDDAYAVQDAIIARTDLSLAGWKVALTNDEAMARADATGPAAGPLFAEHVVANPQTMDADVIARFLAAPRCLVVALRRAGVEPKHGRVGDLSEQRFRHFRSGSRE